MFGGTRDRMALLSPGKPFYHITKGQRLLVTTACRAVISAPASGGGWWPMEGNSRPDRSGGGEAGEGLGEETLF